MSEITLNPIGFVKNSIKEHRIGNFKEEISEIIIDEKFIDALDGIEEYSHIIIVYWMDKIKDYVIKHQPQGKKSVPLVGIFAARCPKRPNPIAITTVKLISRNKNILKVQGLDIINDTPIIDIKPYWPQYDEVKNAKIPSWVYNLEF